MKETSRRRLPWVTVLFCGALLVLVARPAEASAAPATQEVFWYITPPNQPNTINAPASRVCYRIPGMIQHANRTNRVVTIYQNSECLRVNQEWKDFPPHNDLQYARGGSVMFH